MILGEPRARDGGARGALGGRCRRAPRRRGRPRAAGRRRPGPEVAVRRTPPRPFLDDLDGLPVPGLGPRRRLGVSRRLDEGARPPLVERRDDAGLPVPLQLVREAHLGNALRAAEPRQRRRRGAPPRRDDPPGPSLVRRRHLRPLAPLDRVLRRGARRAGRPDPVHDAVARRPHDALRRRGARRTREPRRSGWVSSPGPRRCSTRWTRARASNRPARRRASCVITGSGRRGSSSSAIRARRGRTSSRRDGSSGTERPDGRRRLRLVPPARHGLLRAGPRRDGRADELEDKRRPRDDVPRNLHERVLLPSRARPPPCRGRRLPTALRAARPFVRRRWNALEALETGFRSFVPSRPRNRTRRPSVSHPSEAGQRT